MKSKAEGVSFLRDVMSPVCFAINSEFSLRVQRDIMGQSNVPKYNLDAKCYDGSIEGVRAFALDYLVQNFAKKFVGLRTGKNTRLEAISAWKSSEQKCKETNIRFRFLRGFSPRVLSVLLNAQRKIESWIGHSPSYTAVLGRSKWGSGATATLRRGCGVDKKITTKLSVTSGAVNLARIMIETDPLWFEAITGNRPTGPYRVLTDEIFEIIDHNVHDTVPKDAYTDRNIGKEPTMNGFLQQGVHLFLRDALLRVGVDLRDQTVNQRLARCASVAGLATVDLSSASDTVSVGLVRFLLPEKWFHLLDSLRSKITLLDGERVLLEKFSSMGNAFTFELETLIFLALSRAICDELGLTGSVSVYGDDIIVPAASKELFEEVFAASGFEINHSKTFWDGYFFESCGKHYFHTVDVTPLYQKEDLDTRESLIRCYNRMARWSIRTSGKLRNTYVSRAMRSLIEGYPDIGDRPRIPFFAEGDDGFLSQCETLVWRNQAYNCKVLNSTEGLIPGNPLALLALKLRIPQYSNANPRGWDDVGDGRMRIRYASRRIYPRLSSSHEDDWLLAT
jgi:hypothetical protein